MSFRFGFGSAKKWLPTKKPIASRQHIKHDGLNGVFQGSTDREKERRDAAGLSHSAGKPKTFFVALSHCSPPSVLSLHLPEYKRSPSLHPPPPFLVPTCARSTGTKQKPQTEPRDLLREEGGRDGSRAVHHVGAAGGPDVVLAPRRRRIQAAGGRASQTRGGCVSRQRKRRSVRSLFASHLGR